MRKGVVWYVLLAIMIGAQTTKRAWNGAWDNHRPEIALAMLVICLGLVARIGLRRDQALEQASHMAYGLHDRVLIEVGPKGGSPDLTYLESVVTADAEATDSGRPLISRQPRVIKKMEEIRRRRGYTDMPPITAP